MNEDNQGEERESLVGIARKWLPWCLGLIYVLTAGWAIFLARYEVVHQDHDSLESTIVAVVMKTAPVVPLIILCGMFIVPVADFIGGVIMVTARYLGNKYVKPIIEKHMAAGRAEGKAEGRMEGRAEGRAEGRVEGRAEGRMQGRAEANTEWEMWYNRMKEAREKGKPFNEPPPSVR